MKIPFSFYDFFGYLGAGFLLCVTVDQVAFDGALVASEPTILQGLLLVLAAYVVGHGVAHVAAVLIEELLLRKVLGPSEEVVFGSGAGLTCST